MEKTKRSDLIYALSDFLDGEEWAEPSERESMMAAYKEAATIIRAIADRETTKKNRGNRRG